MRYITLFVQLIGCGDNGLVAVGADKLAIALQHVLIKIDGFAAMRTFYLNVTIVREVALIAAAIAIAIVIIVAAAAVTALAKPVETFVYIAQLVAYIVYALVHVYYGFFVFINGIGNFVKSIDYQLEKLAVLVVAKVHAVNNAAKISDFFFIVTPTILLKDFNVCFAL